MIHLSLDSLPKDKILDWSKQIEFADEKVIEAQQLNFCIGSIENIVGKGKNAGLQHFPHFPECFQRASFSMSLEDGVVC